MYSARSGKYYFQISVSSKVADLFFLTFNSRKNINDSAPLDKQNIVRIDIQILYTVFHRGPRDKLYTIDKDDEYSTYGLLLFKPRPIKHLQSR